MSSPKIRGQAHVRDLANRELQFRSLYKSSISHRGIGEDDVAEAIRGAMEYGRMSLSESDVEDLVTDLSASWCGVGKDFAIGEDVMMTLGGTRFRATVSHRWSDTVIVCWMNGGTVESYQMQIACGLRVMEKLPPEENDE